jgi:hypothetical protein
MRGNSHQNLIFLKLKLVCQPNRTTNFTNSKVELLCGEVGEVELKLVKWSGDKQVLNLWCLMEIERRKRGNGLKF